MNASRASALSEGGGVNWFRPLSPSFLAGLCTGLGALVVVFLDLRAERAAHDILSRPLCRCHADDLRV